MNNKSRLTSLVRVKDVWRVCAFAVLVVIGTCGNASDVMDSRLLLGEYPNIYWLDNRIVVAEAASGEYCEKDNGYRQPLNRIAFLDTETGLFRWHGLAGVAGLCVANGNISYARRMHAAGKCPVDRYEHLMGQIGEEKVMPIHESIGKINIHTCRPESELPRLPAAVEARKETMGSVFVRLKPEHGWVEFAKRMGDPPHVLRQYPAAIIPPGGQAEGRIALPAFFLENLKRISRYDSMLPYYPHRNAYVLRTMHYQSPLPEGVRTTLWWVYPDGRVEEIVSYTRDKSWPLANENSFIPARSGIYFIGADTTLTSYVGLYGLFRYFDDSKRRRIVAGRIGPRALSPDGCKLAFGNDDRRRVDGVRQHKLQVIDLCKGEKK